VFKINDNYSLKEVINLELLQNIQDKFADATGLAAVIVDREGIPVTKSSNFTSFCKNIRSCEKGFQHCKISDAQGGERAREEGKTTPYICKSGLIDMAAPIILENRFIGTILCGQIIIEEEGREKTLERVRELTADINLDFEIIKQEFKSIEVLPRKRLIASMEFLSLTANYIAEMGLVNIYQSELLKESKTRKKLEEYLRIKKLKILQSQVNPHFLFNVLNSIARLSLIENAKETEEVVYALSDLLRYSLKNVEKLVKLEDEINCVKDYITIQEKRHSNKFNFSIEVDEELMDLNIPLLTIQPLVENSIIHGFKDKDSIDIIINSEICENKTILKVKDSGVGINKQIIDCILDSENDQRNKATSHITGIGINNVHKRIKHYFGSDYGLEIVSREDEGTEVRINLPRKSS